MDCREKRELAMRHRLSLGGERWSQNTRELPDLLVGQKVFIQNQRGAGKLAKRWDRTGTVVEDKDHDKYTVKIDGSGRLTDRNRRYLRAFKPDVQNILPAPSPLQSTGVPQGPDHQHSSPAVGQDDGEDTYNGTESTPNYTPSTTHPEITSEPPPSPTLAPTPTPLPTPTLLPTPTPRRSTRAKIPNVRFSSKEFDLARD